MQNKHKIAVIGAAGKAGQFLTRVLLKQNFPIRILLRHPENFKMDNPFVEVVTGDARDPLSVADCLKGCHAVISTIGQPKGEHISVFSESTRNIIQAMKYFKLKRYIVLTGLSVDCPEDQKGNYAAGGTLWMKTNYPVTTLDKQLEWEILKASGLEWTLVRVPMIDLTEEKPEILTSLVDCPGEKISAASLADFLVKQLEDKTFIGQSPFIANR